MRITTGLGFRSSRIKQRKFYRVASLVLASILSFLIRLWTIVHHESSIQDYDPFFNYHAAEYLQNNGFYKFLNWFDHKAWYPLGRIVGGTLYPGIMVTAWVFKSVLDFLNFDVDLRTICIYIPPLFSSFTTLITYGVTKELIGGLDSDCRTEKNYKISVNSKGAGLLAASFISINPGLILRTMAGNFDNENVAIFFMLLTFYFWVKSIKTGHVFYAIWAAISLGLMACSWGGYVYVYNLIPLHVFVNYCIGKFNRKTYVAFSTFYILSVLIIMQVPFIGFSPVSQSTHLPGFFVFVLCQVLAFFRSSRRYLNDKIKYDVMRRSIVKMVGCFVTGTFILAVILSFFSDQIRNSKLFSNSYLVKFYALINPIYAKLHAPIHHSVSENQPSAWSSFYFDLQLLLLLFPVGIWVTLRKINGYNSLLLVFGTTSMFFASSMNRLILILAPAMCISSGIGISYFLMLFTGELNILAIFSRKHRRKLVESLKSAKNKLRGAKETTIHTNRREIASVAVIVVTYFLWSYNTHCNWVAQEAYSTTNVMIGHGKYHADDFREGFNWLRMNTDENAKVLSWWDHGYRIRVIANRTSIVDNNTWNYTHIGMVGNMFAENEKKSAKMMRDLDIDYVYLVFGGALGYDKDDLNKLPWMLKLADGSGFNKKVQDYVPGYFTDIGNSCTKKLRESIIYKLSYYRFFQVKTKSDEPAGFDRVRMQKVPTRAVGRLVEFEEAYTSKNWLVRIYKVKKRNNRGFV
jgi:dolichyl-diphosphooligosaccharide--protein glycosyltransferase